MKGETILLSLAAFLLLAGGAVAQSGDGHDLSWWTVDAGGQTFSTGGGYSLGGTAGQPAFSLPVRSARPKSRSYLP